MRIAVSNIAWDPDEDAAVAGVMQREQVRGVEIAPTKWRDRPFDASASDIAALRRKWNDAGLEIVSLQSLLFGRPDLQLFGGASSRASLDEFMRRVIDFAATVGARRMVFGSPKNRTRGELPMREAMQMASDFFATLGPHAHERGTAICIEANPPGYGCDFVTTTSEAVALARAVNHPGVAVNVDLGGMTMSGEDPRREIEAGASVIRHVHASEPNLAELGAAADHSRAAEGLAAIGFGEWVSIEMRSAGSGKNVDAVERAIKLAKARYS
jgi:sugar phosphate isomerase/epimerase